MWTVQSLFPTDRVNFVSRHVPANLDETGIDSSFDRRKAVNNFTANYLRIDGVLLLRLIAHNTNGITTTEIATALFEHWREQDEEETLRGIEDSEHSKLKD
jgi:hypothetical protein